MAIFSLCFCLSGCSSGNSSGTLPETSMVTEDDSNYVRSNPAANSLEEAAEDPPFSEYTYDFSAYGNNYMITVTPDETRTGLVLTLEDKDFEFSTLNVTPPEGYAVYFPYSQSAANTVCTVIKGDDSENTVPDLLKIDFYLSSFEDETMPYSVCRLYAVSDGKLTEFKVYDRRNNAILSGTDESSDAPVLDYIPESNIFRTTEVEHERFMSDPVVTVNEDGSMEASIVTYTIDMANMTIICENQPCDDVDSTYYGYAVYAIAGNIYKYFRDTSLNVSDYENYVEVPSADGSSAQYFFKVDDPRFSTVQELRDYVGKYFAKDIVDEMFLSAPQKYRDIDGELYTIVGDGGYNDTLGRVFMTGIAEEQLSSDPRVITYFTKQEKFDENHTLIGYVDGGDLTIEITDTDPGFLITKYRYPNS